MNKENAVQVLEYIDTSWSDDNSAQGTKKEKENVQKESCASKTEDCRPTASSNNKDVTINKKTALERTKKDKSVQTARSTETPKSINLYPEITKSDVIIALIRLLQIISMYYFLETRIVWFILYFRSPV